MKWIIHLKKDVLLGISLHATDKAKHEQEFATDIPKLNE